MLKTQSPRVVACAAGLALAGITLITTSANAAHLRYRATLLQPLNGGPVIDALAINANGDSTGSAGTGAVNPGQHAVIWRGSAVQNLDDTYSISQGSVINDAGVIAGVGWACPPLNGTCIGGLARALPGGAFEPVGNPIGGNGGEVLDINIHGDFVGWWYAPNFSSRAFRFTESGGVQLLGSLGGFSEEALAINDAGTIVGSGFNASGQRRAFRWADGVMTPLGTLGGTTSEATDINNAGVIVGSSRTAGGATHAFRIAPGGKMLDIHTLPQAVASYATLINDAGMIGGWWSDGSLDRMFVYTPESGMVDIGAPIEEFRAFQGPLHMNAQGAMVGQGVTNMYQSFVWYWSPETGMKNLQDLVVGGDSIFITTVGGINNAGQIAVSGHATDGFGQPRAVVLHPVAPSDVTADGSVNVDDLIAVILAWGSADTNADIDNSGSVGIDDLVSVILNWT